MSSKTTVGLISLGCAKNRVDSELMIGSLVSEGFGIVTDASEADVIIVNTCAFIESAKSEAINTLLETAELKNGRCKLLVCAGCLAQRYAEEIKKELPEVDALVGTNSVAEIADVVRRGLEEKAENKTAVTEALSTVCGAEYMNGPRVLSTPAGSAYLKIAEGCDNHCTFCAIPGIRGKMRSRPLEEIVCEAEKLAQSGVKEINVIAQDTTKYGRDLYGTPKLKELLEALDKIEGIEMIRTLYMYPDEFDDELIAALSRLKKFVHYIDLPLQHIDDAVLKRMCRRSTEAEIKRVIERVREAMPDCIFRTSFIVGFPGETEAQFKHLMSFVREYAFQRIGVFTYSPEEGTPAEKLSDQIADEVKENRYDRLYSLAQKISLKRNKERVGSTVKVLVESVSDDGIFYVGRSYAEAPDADGKIYFTSEEPLGAGDVVDVKLLIAEEYDMTGQAV